MRVKIDHHDNIMLQTKFFEHAAGRDNIAFLMKDKDVRFDILQHYINVVEARYVTLELMKKELCKKYEPEILHGRSYDYVFDFDNEEIEYIHPIFEALERVSRV